MGGDRATIHEALNMNPYVNSLIAFITLLFTYSTFRQHRRNREARHRNGCQLPVKYKPWDQFMAIDLTVATHGDIPSLHRLHKDHGHTFQVEPLFDKTTIFTIAPENIKMVNMRQDHWGIQPQRLEGMEFFCGRGFLTMDGEMWQHARKLIRPSFTKSNISDLSVLSRETDKFLEQLPPDGETVDLQPLLYIMFLNTSLHFLLGISADEVEKEAPCTPDEFVDNFHGALFLTMVRMLLGPLWKIFPKGKYLRVCKTAHSYLDYYVRLALDSDVAEAHKSSSGQRSLVQGLSSQSDDIAFIRSQVLQGMMASQETTSALLGNAFFLLARHPIIWHQVREEVLAKGEALFDFDALLGSRMLRNVLLESLRLYPIFPLMGRIALCDTVLPVGGGPIQDAPIFASKGTQVEVGNHALHRDPNVFGDDVEDFRPDRWNAIDPAQFEFMGYGGGNRACLGRQKSLVEAEYVLARMAQRFERMESRDSMDWKGDMKLTCKNANGCKVAVFS